MAPTDFQFSVKHQKGFLCWFFLRQRIDLFQKPAAVSNRGWNIFQEEDELLMPEETIIRRRQWPLITATTELVSIGPMGDGGCVPKWPSGAAATLKTKEQKGMHAQSYNKASLPIYALLFPR